MQLKTLRRAATGVALSAAALSVTGDGAAQGSTRWVISPQLSLAWWQIVPDLGHLWATTCPREPSWQPGEGRTGDWVVDYARRPQTFASGVGRRGLTPIPIFPRAEATPVCSPAVTGEVFVAGPGTWDGVTGTIRIAADSLITGNRFRDRFARGSVLQTQRHPEIRFAIDSLRLSETGDTLRGLVFGDVEIRGNRRAVEAPVTAWREAGGLRVQSQFHFPAQELTDTFDISKKALGLSVGLKVWDQIHMGIDVVLLPPRRGAAGD